MKKPVVLNQTDLVVLREVADQLDYFSEATDLFEGKQQATICRVIPVLISLESALSMFTAKTVSATALNNALLHALRTRFHEILYSVIHIIATILDPSVKLSFTRTDKRNCFSFDLEACKKRATAFLITLNDTQEIRIHGSTAHDSTAHGAQPAQPRLKTVSVCKSPAKKRLMDYYMPEDEGESATSEKHPVEQALNSYLESDRQASPSVEYCISAKSVLSNFALEILCVPATSASVERVFSRAGCLSHPVVPI